MRGTWQTEETAGSGRLVLIGIVLLLLAASGAAAEVAAAVIEIVIAVAVLAVVAVIALAAFLVYRARRTPGRKQRHRSVPPSLVRQLGPEPQRPAIAAPRELHLHFHGADPAEVAEVLRRHG